MKKKQNMTREGSHVAVGEVKPLSQDFKLFVSSEPEDLTKPLVSEDEMNAINNLYNKSNLIETDQNIKDYEFMHQHINKNLMDDYIYDPSSPWIQTYSGIRFSPLNPNINSINILDIAHALSMQCRFTGHSRFFYSVAQHSVLVSYLCNEEDRKHALLHDGSEFALSDMSTPIKKSGKFENYKMFEKQLQEIIYKRFDLDPIEPASVKKADLLMLYTEERDLFKVHRDDWIKGNPAPFKIEPLPPQEAKDLFMKRFFDLWGHEGAYEHYLKYEYA